MNRDVQKTARIYEFQSIPLISLKWGADQIDSSLFQLLPCLPPAFTHIYCDDRANFNNYSISPEIDIFCT